jgi:hypothetical protein
MISCKLSIAMFIPHWIIGRRYNEGAVFADNVADLALVIEA